MTPLTVVRSDDLHVVDEDRQRCRAISALRCDRYKSVQAENIAVIIDKNGYVDPREESYQSEGAED